MINYPTLMMIGYFMFTGAFLPLCFRHPRMVIALKPAPLQEIPAVRRFIFNLLFFIEWRNRVCYLSAPLLRKTVQ
jgi:hypothetical protein